MKYGVVHSMHVWLSQTMTWLYEQVRALPPRIQNHVVCDTTSNLDQFPFDNITSAEADPPAWRFIKAHAWPIARRRNAYLLRRRISRSGARILHSHFGDRGWENIADARRTHVKHVVSFYGYDVSLLPTQHPEWKARYQSLFDSADLLLCEGPHLGRCLEHLGCPPEKIHVHHLGIDVSRIAFRPRTWQPGQPLRVLLSGTFTEKKGLPYAIEALGRIQHRAALKITVIGDATGQERHQREKARILAMLSQTGLREHTTLLGFQPHANLVALCHSHHVFVSPSITASDGDTEGGAPVSIIEMAASGMPVVSTSHCDIPEVLEHGVSGLLATERDVDGLERHLTWLIDHPDDWTRLATAARARIETEFCSKKQGQRLAAHYDALAEA